MMKAKALKAMGRTRSKRVTNYTAADAGAIIEGLIQDGYVNRQNRELIATAKGISLIGLLRVRHARIETVS